MADEHPGAETAHFFFQVFRHLPFRRFGFARQGSRTAPLPFRRFPLRPPSATWAGHISRRAKPVEHVAYLLGQDPAHDLGNALAEDDPAPLGIALRRIALLVVRGHVLGPVTRQGVNRRGVPTPIGTLSY